MEAGAGAGAASLTLLKDCRLYFPCRLHYRCRMTEPIARIAAERLVAALLAGRGTDRALDALIQMLADDPRAARSGLCPVAAARRALACRPPRYTALAEASAATARRRGYIIAKGGRSGKAWAGVWLPAAAGGPPLLMFGPDEARSAAAALAEAMRIDSA
jgi:hypothetical protein